jgi:hypothetical protein
MKANIFRVTGYVALALFVSGASAKSEPLTPVRLAPDEFKWERASTGNERANLVGDDRKPGMYMYRT